ncbi:MAG TPA: hypothetical protein VGP02_16720 [Mycobacteriales bacterium]|nr:hypothetical protein [Mycobacteriales bacterium]
MRGVERWTVRAREGTPRPAVDARSLLDAVRALDGVTDATLGPDAAGHHSLRLTLADGVDDAAVAARVADVLDGRFGVPVDARRSEPAEYTGPERRSGTPERRLPRTASVVVPTVDVESVMEAVRLRPSTPYGHPRSVLFQRMTVVTSVGEFGAEVVLSTAAGRSTGRASGPANDGSALHTVSRAALAAMDGILAGVGRCSFEDAHVALVGGRRTVLVAITLLTPGNAERLVGCAAVEEDTRQAVVRACLAALDRRAEGLLGARRSTLEA